MACAHQKIWGQRDALRKISVEVDHIYSDVVSGTKEARSRPGMQRLLGFARPGDTVGRPWSTAHIAGSSTSGTISSYLRRSHSRPADLTSSREHCSSRLRNSSNLASSLSPNDWPGRVTLACSAPQILLIELPLPISPCLDTALTVSKTDGTQRVSS